MAEVPSSSAVRIDSSGHVVGRVPKPRSEVGRIRVVFAVVTLVGIVCLALGSLTAAKRLEGDHVVIATVRDHALEERTRGAAEPAEAAAAIEPRR
jgi:hypothetical protein